MKLYELRHSPIKWNEVEQMNIFFSSLFAAIVRVADLFLFFHSFIRIGDFFRVRFVFDIYWDCSFVRLISHIWTSTRVCVCQSFLFVCGVSRSGSNNIHARMILFIYFDFLLWFFSLFLFATRQANMICFHLCLETKIVSLVLAYDRFGCSVRCTKRQTIHGDRTDVFLRRRKNEIDKSTCVDRWKSCAMISCHFHRFSLLPSSLRFISICSCAQNSSSNWRTATRENGWWTRHKKEAEHSQTVKWNRKKNGRETTDLVQRTLYFHSIVLGFSLCLSLSSPAFRTAFCWAIPSVVFRFYWPHAHKTHNDMQ